MITCEKPITDVITRNKLALFSQPTTNEKSRDKQAADSWKQDCSTMLSLYISGLVREGNPDEFFQYENNSYPPALSDHGKLAPGKDRADLVGSIEKSCKLPAVPSAPTADIKIFDGPALVHLLTPKAVKPIMIMLSQYSYHILKAN